MSTETYCLVCGSALIEGDIPTETRARLYCASCGYIHYINPKVVCGTLPVQAGRVWLLRRGIEPRLGYWTYPAGFQEIDESSDEAAVRTALLSPRWLLDTGRAASRWHAACLVAEDRAGRKRIYRKLEKSLLKRAFE